MFYVFVWSYYSFSSFFSSFTAQSRWFWCIIQVFHLFIDVFCFIVHLIYHDLSFLVYSFLIDYYCACPSKIPALFPPAFTPTTPHPCSGPLCGFFGSILLGGVRTRRSKGRIRWIKPTRKMVLLDRYTPSICLRIRFIFPCWFERESITTGSISIFPRGLKQMENLDSLRGPGLVVKYPYWLATDMAADMYSDAMVSSIGHMRLQQAPS